MNIYLVSRQELPGRDENSALVVIAATEYGAREYAASMAGEEGPGAWVGRKSTAIVTLLGNSAPGVYPGVHCVDRFEG